MPVKRGPWAIDVNRDHAEVSNALLELADAVRDDADITGVVVIVHRRSNAKSNDLQTMRAGVMSRSASMLVYALHRTLRYFV